MSSACSIYKTNIYLRYKEVKEAGYKGLVHPILEYGSSVWDPQGVVLQEELETVPRRAARFVTGWKVKAQLLIIGLDNAGKSTLLDRVASGRMLQHPPTTQCRSKQLSLGSLTFTAFDLGGHKQARRVWRDYFPAVDGIIFMVDVADVERFSEAQAELYSLLHDEDIFHKPVVVLANKTDKQNAVGEEMVVNSLGLSIYRTGKKLVSKSELPGRPLEVFPCSILRQEGYGDAFRWLAHYVKQQ